MEKITIRGLMPSSAQKLAERVKCDLDIYEVIDDVYRAEVTFTGKCLGGTYRYNNDDCWKEDFLAANGVKFTITKVDGYAKFVRFN